MICRRKKIKKIQTKLSVILLFVCICRYYGNPGEHKNNN